MTVRIAWLKRSSHVGSSAPPKARCAGNRVASSKLGEVVDRDHQQDLAGVTGNEVHDEAHRRSRGSGR